MIRSVRSNVVREQAKALIPPIILAFAVKKKRVICYPVFCRSNLLRNCSVHFLNKQRVKRDSLGLRLGHVDVAILKRLIPPLPIAIPAVGIAVVVGAIHDDRFYCRNIPARCRCCLLVLNLAPKLSCAHWRKDHRHLAIVQRNLGAVWEVDVSSQNCFWSPVQRILPRQDARAMQEHLQVAKLAHVIKPAPVEDHVVEILSKSTHQFCVLCRVGIFQIAVNAQRNLAHHVEERRPRVHNVPAMPLKV